MDETQNDDYVIEAAGAGIPPKPELESKSKPTNWGRTVFSMVLFLGLFMLIGIDLPVVLALIFVIGLHEAGHFIAMRAFGYKNVNMFFVPLLGAFVSGERRETPPGAEIIMLLAGPVPGILIGCALLLLGTSTDGPPLEMLLGLGGMFLLINLFNMLPFYPLDGGRIMESLFARGNLYIRIGLLGLSLAALVAFIISTNQIIIGIFGFSIVQQISASFAMIKLRKEMDLEGIPWRKTYSALTDEEYFQFSNYIMGKQPEMSNPQQRAQYIASLTSQTTGNLSVLDTIIYLLAWIFFLIGPVYLILGIFSEDLLENLMVM